MQDAQFFSNFRTHVLTALMTIGLSGCLLSDEVEEPDPVVGEEQFVVVGSVGDGPIVGAAMRVLDNNGSVLMEFESSDTAGFNINVSAADENYPLTIDAQNGIDLVTGLAPDFMLLGLVLEPSERSVANVSPFSTIILQLASSLDGGLTRNNVDMAEGIVTTVLNSGLSSLMVDGPMRSPIDESNVAEMVKSSESLSELIRRTRDWTRIAGDGASGDSVVDAISADLVDGVIDGVGREGAESRTAAIASIGFAQVLLESMSNELHVNGTVATENINSAIQQIGYANASPTIAELTATENMLVQARIGVAVADFVSADPEISTLRDSVNRLQPGLQPELVRNLLPANYRQLLNDALAIVAGADQGVIDAVTDLIRTGGELPEENLPPVIQGVPASSVESGNLYSFIPVASDGDGDNLVFSIANPPAWATFDSTTGRLQGTPVEADVADYAGILITVSDGQAAASLPAFSVSVTSAIGNSPPTITGTPPTTVLEGASYQFLPAANDPDGDALTFTISNMPAWTSFDVVSGTLQGVPTASDAGVYSNIIISVSDGMAVAALPAFSVTVQALAVNSPPTISGSPAPSVEEGELYSFAPTASDPDGDQMTFTISGRPPWASFNSVNGVLQGTPAATDQGIHGGIAISVSDGSATSTLQTFSITVNALPVNTPPTISGTPPAVVTVNSQFQFTPAATDADGDTLQFTATGLPSWVTFSTVTGEMSGTPGVGDVGNFSGIVITVSDGNDDASIGPFSITVEAISLGSATLSWNAPTVNTDGSALNDLAGYRIYWRSSPGPFTNSVTLNNPGLTSYVIENLAPGTYEFASTAFNSNGVESDFSNSASKTIP